MTGLQEAFYIVGLVYMGISLLIIFSILVVIAKIRQRVISLEKMVQEKLSLVTSVGATAGEVINTVRKFGRHKEK